MKISPVGAIKTIELLKKNYEKKKVNELTTADLKNRLKIARTVTGMFAVALLVLFFASIYLTLTQKFTPLTMVSVAMLPLLILDSTSIGKIKSEINSREN